MGNSAVTGKIKLGSHFPICEENTYAVNTGQGIPASVRRIAGMNRARLNQVKTENEIGVSPVLLIPVSAARNSPHDFSEGVMQISTDPEYLRQRANAAEIAGNFEQAEALFNEANELESVSAPADAAPQ